MLLGELIKKFPLPVPPLPKSTQIAVTPKQESENGNTENKDKPDVKQEKIKPPPEKKPRLN